MSSGAPVRTLLHKGPDDPDKKKRATFGWLVVAIMVCFASPGSARAHDVPRSESRIEVHEREVRVEFRLDLLELGYVDTKGTGFISTDELDNSIGLIYADFKQHFVVGAPDPPIQITLERYRVVEDHVVDMELVYEFSHDVTELTLTSTLSQITRPVHQHLTNVNMNGTLEEAVLNASNPTATFTSGEPNALRAFGSFLRLGIMHIFTGYDHLAFLVGLLIVTTNLKSLIKIITAFTVAHSITLALATLDIVELPTRLTESVIALSIAYVAVENLLGMRVIARYRIAFLFGLVHGFGFSSVLREMGLSRGHLALSLFSFNLGVEIGQVAFVLALFPLIVYVTASSSQRRFQMSVSLIVLCLATYWFVQRAFLA
jgi:hypothetical protein